MPVRRSTVTVYEPFTRTVFPVSELVSVSRCRTLARSMIGLPSASMNVVAVIRTMPAKSSLKLPQSTLSENKKLSDSR